MKYEKVLELVGKKVEIKFFDNDVRQGTLSNVIDRGKRAFLLAEHRLYFVASHVVSIKVLEDEV